MSETAVAQLSGIEVDLATVLSGALSSGLSLSGNGASSTQRVTFPKTSAAASGVIDYKENLFVATYDPTLYVGVNQDANGNVVTASAPGLAWAIEGDYDDGSGTHKMEAYLQWRAANNTGAAVRPIFFQLNRATGQTTGYALTATDLRINADAAESDGNATRVQVTQNHLNLFPNTGTAHNASINTIALYSAAGQPTQFYMGYDATINVLLLQTVNTTQGSLSVGGQVAFRAYKLGSSGSLAVGGANDNTATLVVESVTNAVANQPVVIVRANGSQSVDAVQVQNSSSAVLSGFNKSGAFFTNVHAAPADADVAAGQCFLWFDQTNGAAKLMVKAKQADGTVKTGSVTLA